MLLRRTCLVALVFAAIATSSVPAHAQLITGGDSLFGKLNPFQSFDPSQPIDVITLSKRIDCLSEKLRDDGLIVVKQPDVFGQARLTRFRTDFENQMNQDLGTFHLVLAARIGRLDSATTTSTTSLAAALSAPGTTNVHVPTGTSGGSTPASTATPTGAGTSALPTAPQVPAFGAGNSFDPSKTAFSGLGLDKNMASLNSVAAGGALSLGVEPTVYLDEKKRFLEHLNEIRRINLGPDQNDSSGYGLYVVRMPVSITPGECTYQGHGADLAVTVEHEFPANFLQDTYRTLVINDLIDQLAPLIFEIIRSPNFDKLDAVYQRNHKKQNSKNTANSGNAGLPEPFGDAEGSSNDEYAMGERAGAVFDLLSDPHFRKYLNLSLSSTRGQKGIYPIAPRELINFFLPRNIYLIARDVKQSLLTKNPRATDVRSYLRHSLYVAYTAMAKTTRPNLAASPPLNTDLIQEIYDAVSQRQFTSPGMPDPHAPQKRILGDSPLESLYKELVVELQKSRENMDEKVNGSNHQPLASLCWAIAVDAGLFDHALHEEIPKVLEAHGIHYVVPPEMHFYYQNEMLEDAAKAVFNDFVRYKWPVVTFALDPVTDQQNVADSFNLKRDLQLALSFAFATGQISFSQLSTFRRQIEQSSDTIALNRTVTGFAHGNDTFGFRFTPRFQNPPNQRTNLGVIASQLIGGGPGPDYQTKKSKLEPGIRELTAVLLLPTFMPTMRMQITSNWFKLTDPEHLVFHSKRMLERGREVQDLRQAVVDACSARQYRDADLRVLQAKLNQLDKMLPSQSTVVQLPFENISTSFELMFQRGANALVPELTGYNGADYILQGKAADIFIFGRYISLLDTKVIVGGAVLPTGSGSVDILSREVVHINIPATANPTVTEDGKTYYEVYLATPNGISNRVLVPCLPAAPAPQVAFELNPKDSTELDIFYQWITGPDGKPTLIATDDPSGGGKKTINITWDSPTGIAPKTLQATFTAMANGQMINFSLPANTGTTGDYTVDPRVITVALLNRLQKIVTSPTLLPASVSVTIQVQPYVPVDSMGYRVLTTPKALKTPLTVKLVPNVTNTNVLRGVTEPPPPPAPPAKAGASKSTDNWPSGELPLRMGSRDSDASLIRTAQALPLMGQVPNVLVPPPADLSSIANQLGALAPPPPPPSIASLQQALPNLQTAATTAVTGLANQVATTAVLPSQVATTPAQSIVVNTPPVVVVAPSTVLPAKSKCHSRLSKLFSHNRNGSGQ